MKNQILTFLFFTFMLSSCYSQLQEDITGKWKIEEKENVGEFKWEQDVLKNSSFFGSELWADAVGKYFEFRLDGHVETDIAGVNMSEVIELIYHVSKENEILNFTAINLKDPNTESFEFFVELEVKNDETMFWTLDGLTKFKLKRTD